MIKKKIDSVGRIVIPMEIRYSLGWKPDDEIGIVDDGEQLILKKFIPHEEKCGLCGKRTSLSYIDEVPTPICAECINKVIKLH